MWYRFLHQQELHEEGISSESPEWKEFERAFRRKFGYEEID
jgi:hypothetical protein